MKTKTENKEKLIYLEQKRNAITSEFFTIELKIKKEDNFVVFPSGFEMNKKVYDFMTNVVYNYKFECDNIFNEAGFIEYQNQIKKLTELNLIKFDPINTDSYTVDLDNIIKLLFES